MSEHEDKDERVTPIERKTIQEAIASQVETRRREALEAEHAERRRAQDERRKGRRGKQFKEARDRKARRLKAVNEANARVRSNVAAAAGSLRAALRAAGEVSAPRHSDEGRQQQRTVRSIQDAMGNLRRIGAGDFDETNFEVDLDLDLG